MFRWLGLSPLFLLLLRKLIGLWVRVQVLPHDLSQLGIDPAKPVCYVLPNRMLSNALTLETEAIALNLPRPLRSLRHQGLRERYSLITLTRGEPMPFAKPKHRFSPRLEALVEALQVDPTLDVQLVPVSLFWGRSPDKQNSWFKALFADAWATPSALKQFVTILIHGRMTMMKLSPPLSLRQVCADTPDTERAVRKVSRILRVHFRHERTAAIGPDMSHRRTLLSDLMRSERVEAAIQSEVTEKGVPLGQAQAAARRYGHEIASDFSYPVLRFFELFLTWLWTRLYNGIEVHHFERVEAYAKTHEVVYVPCHRSHIDYLLLSYVIFTRGLMVPHIAAGSNLNMPVVGPLLRRGGAFFLRRSFKDNPLYGAVFHEYLHRMVSGGFPIEYFVEGGRSRTGRLLAAKLGMINMTVRSFMKDSHRPLVFIPAYIGYEKLMEGGTYIGELQGKPKQKENLFSLLLSIRKLQKVFGKVHLSFGEPIDLGSQLDADLPGWRDNPAAADLPAVVATNRSLGHLINVAINASAVINPVNLLSTVLLSTPKHAIDEAQLAEQIDLYRTLLTALPYSADQQITPLTGAECIAYGETLKILQRKKHPLGDLIYLHEEAGVLMTYFRNNTLHVFALPSLLAVLVLQRGDVSREQLKRQMQQMYPFLQAELFLRWSLSELDALIDEHIMQFLALGLMRERSGGCLTPPARTSEAHARLHVLSRALRQTLVRYDMTITVLNQRGSGRLTAQQLEELCHLLAQRLSFVREFSAPEFFDKALFRGFVDTLMRLNLLRVNEDGLLVFDQALSALAEASLEVLPSGIRQAILHVTLVSDEDVQRALTQPQSKAR